MSGIVSPKRLSVDFIKSRLLNVAQTSLYQLTIGTKGPLQTYLNSEYRLSKNYNGVIENIQLLCSEASLPGSSLATHEVTNDYHGVTEKMAYRRIYDDSIDLTFYVDRSYDVIEFFDGWMNYIVGEGSREGSPRASYKSRYKNYRMIYPSEYTSTLYLTKFEKDHHTPNSTARKDSMTYTFIEAFPTNIVSMPVSYEASNILKCTVSFSYIRYIRERIVSSIPPSVQNSRNTGNPEAKVANQFGPAFNGDPYTINQNIPGAFSGGVLEGDELFNSRPSRVEEGLPYVGRFEGQGPIAPFSGI